MSDETPSGFRPIGVEVEEGKNYFFCACGKSENLPFCDGTHKGSEKSPIKWTAEETRRVSICTCNKSDRFPFCDGAHKKLNAEANKS